MKLARLTASQASERVSTLSRNAEASDITNLFFSGHLDSPFFATCRRLRPPVRCRYPDKLRGVQAARWAHRAMGV